LGLWMPFSQANANALLQAHKVLAANIRWRQQPSRRGRRYKLEARVLVRDTGELLTLKGTVGKTNFSFALLYANYPICKYTKHHKHHNPTCQVLTRGHIHTWDELHEDGMAEEANHIDEGDINNAFMQFLKECNIQLIGTYKPFLF